MGGYRRRRRTYGEEGLKVEKMGGQKLRVSQGDSLGRIRERG